MSTPRRRIIRPTMTRAPVDVGKLSKLRSRLHQARQDFARWLSRLKRAFHCVEKLDRRINRMERHIYQIEDHTQHDRNGVP